MRNGWLSLTDRVAPIWRNTQKPHTASVSLLFHTFGGQYYIDHSVRIYANPLSLFAEAVAIPLQILLVVFRHMFRNGAVLPGASFQTAVGSNAVM